MGAKNEDRALQIAVCWHRMHRMLFTCVQSLEPNNNIHSLVVTVEVPFDILDN